MLAPALLTLVVFARTSADLAGTEDVCNAVPYITPAGASLVQLARNTVLARPHQHEEVIRETGKPNATNASKVAVLDNKTAKEQEVATPHNVAAEKAIVAEKKFAETAKAQKTAAQKAAEEMEMRLRARKAQEFLFNKTAAFKKAVAEKDAAEKLAVAKIEEAQAAKEKVEAARIIVANKTAAAEKAAAEHARAQKRAERKARIAETARNNATEAHEIALEKAREAQKAAAAVNKAEKVVEEVTAVDDELLNATEAAVETVVGKRPVVKKHPAGTEMYKEEKLTISSSPKKAQVSLSTKRTGGAHGFHDIVGYDGAYLLTLEREPRRANYALEQLRAVGIFPENFTSTDAWGTPQNILEEGCNEGCTPVEAAIAHSHKRALEAASLRKGNWTAIFEDDAVPVLANGMTGKRWDAEFRHIWSQLPAETKMVRLNWCLPAGEGQMVSPPVGDGEMLFTKVHPNGLCTAAYMVHKDIVPKILEIFPCNCALDCCLTWKFFDSPGPDGKYLHHTILSNLDMVGSSSFIKSKADRRGLDMHGVIMQAFNELGSTLEPAALDRFNALMQVQEA
mmetsp:Transcript_143468/g.260986  ORF Transcript_143468/g.260986 Transcript_143468/m.260986 type:complete len:567 (-) Transcript_143468:291-1991(-)